MFFLCPTISLLHREPGDNQQHQLAGTIGVPMCQAMMEYNQGNYSRSVELLYPLRYRMVGVGGSDAQVKYTEMGSCGKLKANKKINKIKHRPNCSFIMQLKNVEPWGITFFGYHWSYCIVSSWAKQNTLLWNRLEVRNALHKSHIFSLREHTTYWVCGAAHRTNIWIMHVCDGCWWTDSMFFVFRKPFPKVQQCIYNITQKVERLYIQCWPGLCSLMGLSTVVCRGISSINCLFTQPWNQRISTTRNWEGNAQQGFEAKHRMLQSFPISVLCIFATYVFMWDSAFYVHTEHKLYAPVM